MDAYAYWDILETELQNKERKQLLKWGKSGINLGKLKLTMKLNNLRLTKGKSQSLRNSQY